ncbi:precorrin-6y C5,15-methyltransferase (decarboxylating) subunit CbiE [Micromonospora sp. BRA006-A]|nr:precorrin-6y C5,15-methyltransferase (decarboxylating) subunit CbiE [Micromonospora sp. BRA006-A]
MTVVGVGADGWVGLPEPSRALVRAAATLLGGRRHLEAVPPVDGQQRVAWPSPLRDNLPGVLASARGPVVVLASGDPLVSGIGTTLLDVLGPERVTIVPGVSSVALARARLGWPAESVTTVSLVGRDLRLIVPALSAGRRLLVLSSDGTTPAAAAVLTGLGWGQSRLVVLGDLGAAGESYRDHRGRVGPERRAAVERSRRRSSRCRSGLGRGRRVARRRVRARRADHQT